MLSHYQISSMTYLKDFTIEIIDFIEQPSSSSISTTTSSVTSMTSLEHESNDTSVSASDYGADNWDQENWGDMDVSQTS